MTCLLLLSVTYITGRRDHPDRSPRPRDVPLHRVEHGRVRRGHGQEYRLSRQPIFQLSKRHQNLMNLLNL